MRLESPQTCDTSCKAWSSVVLLSQRGVLLKNICAVLTPAWFGFGRPHAKQMIRDTTQLLAMVQWWSEDMTISEEFDRWLKTEGSMSSLLCVTVRYCIFDWVKCLEWEEAEVFPEAKGYRDKHQNALCWFLLSCTSALLALNVNNVCGLELGLCACIFEWMVYLWMFVLCLPLPSPVYAHHICSLR